MVPQQGVLEISESRLRRNLALLRQRIGPAALCATIKADAYGHGLRQLAPLLRAAEISWAAVYSLEEAATLARFGFEVLVLSPVVLTAEHPSLPEPGPADLAKIRLNVTDVESAQRLSELAEQLLPAGPPLAIHMQVDAGLTRMGVLPGDAPELAAVIAKLPGLRLEGLFAHFSHGDVPGDPTVDTQLRVLQGVAGQLKPRHPNLIVHMQNSGGAAHLGDAGLNMVRIGIALYGLQPSMDDPIEGLLPVARVVAPVLAIHDRPAGTGVGYGHTFRTNRPSRLAIVPVGYADGYPRHLSNRCVAQVRRQSVAVVGRVSMDQIILDVTDVSEARVGDEVTVISWDPAEPNCLDRMAQSAGTIGYELATHLGGRLHRRIVP